MTRVAGLEERVRELSKEELAEFREWFSGFDGDAWDRQLASDVKAGRLDSLGEQALRDHAAGKTTLL